MKKILVVDDDASTLDILNHLLTSRDFNVKTHSSGLDVPDIVNTYNPHLVLLDVRLPGKLGTHVCNELKQVYQNLPIILFTTHTQEGLENTGCADAFITKPFDVTHLLTTINVLIGQV